jgi:hypothetical protein
MNDFHRTPMGRKFYESDLPRLIEVLERLGKHMEQSNQLQEKKFKLEEKLTRLQIKNLNESSKTDVIF